MRYLTLLIGMLCSASALAWGPYTNPPVGSTNGTNTFVYSGALSGIPATCTSGKDISFITDATAGQNLYYCTASNTWTQELNSGGTPSHPVNAQVGTTYTVLQGDLAKLLTFSNAAAVAVTLPQAGSGGNFASGWSTCFQNRGAGTVTITPTTSTIDGAASLALAQTQGACVYSDGTNYFTQRGTSGNVAIGSGVSGLGTGVATGLGVNQGSNGGVVLSQGASTTNATYSLNFSSSTAGANNYTVSGATINPSTGAAALPGALTISGALNGATNLTPSGTLTNGDFCTYTSTGPAVNCNTASTGTGNVVLSASPTITGTAVTFTSGTARTIANAAEIIVCTSTCTVTPPGTATAGEQFCVQNADNVSTVITLAGVTGVQYEATARTSYGTAAHTMTSGGAVGDQMCMVAISGTQWNVFSYKGTWTNN